MAQFSKSERWISSILSSFPLFKGFIKQVYVRVNYIIYRKNYKFRFLFHQIKKIYLVEPLTKGEETFFGYYDKSPENNNGWIIFNETGLNTYEKPSSNKPIWINAINIQNKSVIPISDSFSYNWQQGCRAQWISSDRLIFNFFNDATQKYNSAVYSISKRQVERKYDLPVQDSFHDDYFLSVNYSRIMRVRPDYGYRNLPFLDEKEMRNLASDGIWKVDYNSGNKNLIVSLQDVVNLQPLSTFKGSLHKVNHVTISPDGNRFIFIHRWYQKGRRFDRLILFDNGCMKVLSDDEMVSHMCWIDDYMLFGYFRHQRIAGFFFININTGEITACDKLNTLDNGDGHPSCYKDWIVIDSYPDKSRMQHLTLYNYKTHVIIPLLELFHPLKNQGESRCDLHPRFSPDGCRIYFDTLYTGTRRLTYIDVSNTIHS